MSGDIERLVEAINSLTSVIKEELSDAVASLADIAQQLDNIDHNLSSFGEGAKEREPLGDQVYGLAKQLRDNNVRGELSALTKAVEKGFQEVVAACRYRRPDPGRKARRKIMKPLTRAELSGHSGKTTTKNGNPAPRKPCGFFMLPVRAYLAIHQGDGGAGEMPVSRIGRLRFTSGDKATVSTVRANNRDRFFAVVAAEVCPLYARAAASDSIHSTTEQLAMTTENTPSTLHADAIPGLAEVMEILHEHVCHLGLVASMTRLTRAALANASDEDIDTALLDIYEKVRHSSHELDLLWLKLGRAERMGEDSNHALH